MPTFNNEDVPVHPEILRRLSDVRTPQALLSRDPRQLRDDLGQHVPLREVRELRASVAEALARGAHGRDAETIRRRARTEEELNDPRSSSSWLPGSVSALELSRAEEDDPVRGCPRTRVAALDELLGGGAAFGVVTELVGPSASGKTRTATTIALDALRRTGARVHWLVAGGGGGTATAIAVAARRILSHRRTKDDDAVALLRRLELHRVSNGCAALAVLAGIDAARTNRNVDRDDRRLIVLDGAGGCLSPWLDGDADGGVGAALASGLAAELRRTARTRDDAVLVINGVVATTRKNDDDDDVDSSRRYRPAMRRVWRVADVRVATEIVRDETDGAGRKRRIVRATLDKHYARPRRRRRRPGPNGEEEDVGDDAVEFALTADGVSDAR